MTNVQNPAPPAAPDSRPFSPGLAGVVGAESAIGLVDGENGRLLYRGYPIGQLVERGTYGEVADLLWTGEWHPGA
jgi:citrate synthase